METLFVYGLFFLFAALAIGCAISMLVQPNPLYSAISLIGVFIALAGLYVMLAAPFIAAVQIIVYAGAIMVLVVFVIMLLNVEEEERRPARLRSLLPIAIVLAAVLIAEAAFVIYSVGTPSYSSLDANSTAPVGLTSSIGIALFTKYLLPFEITSILLLMAIVGAITLARQASLSPAEPRRTSEAAIAEPSEAGTPNLRPVASSDFASVKTGAGERAKTAL